MDKPPTPSERERKAARGMWIANLYNWFLYYLFIYEKQNHRNCHVISCDIMSLEMKAKFEKEQAVEKKKREEFRKKVR